MGASNDKSNDLQEKKKDEEGEESDREQKDGEQAWKSEIEDFQMLLLQDETMDESKSAAKGAPNERQNFQLLSFSVLKNNGLGVRLDEKLQIRNYHDKNFFKQKSFQIINFLYVIFLDILNFQSRLYWKI